MVIFSRRVEYSIAVCQAADRQTGIYVDLSQDCDKKDEFIFFALLGYIYICCSVKKKESSGKKVWFIGGRYRTNVAECRANCP